jgi:protoporphyrinogen oxidase
MTPYHSDQSWAVVGGGFLGMTLALRLAQQGKAVALFESAKSLGGLASAWQLADIVWDRHYHVTLASDTYLRSLLRELGLEDDLRWTKARTGFFVDSNLYSMSSALEFLRFPPLNLFEKLRLGATILRASRIREAKALERLAVEAWLRRWSGAAVTEKIWLPLLRAKLGDGYRDASAAFIWATIARMYAARRSGAKTEMFGYVPGGYARILQVFERTLRLWGVQLRLGRPVRSIVSAADGGLQISVDSTGAEKFSHAVVTTTAPLALQICPELTAEEKDRLANIKYQGIVCASLLLKNSLSPFYITNITDDEIPYTAVIEMSALVDKSQFGGRALVYLPKYLSPDSSYFSRSDEQIREDLASGLERMYPHFNRSDIICFQVSRVKYLLPIPTINYSANLPPTATSVPALHIVNSTQIVDGTLNVNETIRLAEAAAQRFAQPVVEGISQGQSLHHEFAPAHR